ncbi:hypothetical protein [Enterococcus hirae]|uniref:hypothetical protein n=1 Tax=Enterococcus hirae TaxID=1354 RepID=UPI000FFC3CAC|nr:hypothetical protein [Enterococcus hirae]RXA84194.1 hypothetical protein EQ868_14085 [Enterococcus hirae]
MANRVSLRKNERKKYQKMVVIILGVFLFFFGSSLIIKPKTETKSTNIGEKISVDMRTIQLVEKNYYPKNETLVFSFLSPVNSSNVLDELKVTAKQNRSDNTKYKIVIEQISDELYVVKIKDLPDTWEKLTVSIYPKNINIDSLTDTQKLYFTRKNSTTKEIYNDDRSEKSYELTAINFEINQIKSDLEKSAKSIENHRESIKKIEQVNKNLEESLNDKTPKEQEEVEQTIEQNKSQIQTIEKEISTLKENDTELHSKLKKLNERKQELQN